MLPTGLVTDPGFLAHNTGPSHPESPRRLEAILRRLESTDLSKRLVRLPAPLVDRRWLETVHTPRHVDRIESAAPEQGYVYLDADTPMSPGSYRAALQAVGGTLAAIDAVMAGRIANAFCAIRPPGHHAEPARAMGFCLFNNVAVAARYVQRQHGLGRVLILDWDVHHGNGTQAAFYDDPTVLYVSLHQYPWYPGTGGADERGAGPGEGYTLNVPMAAGRGDEEYLAAFDAQITPAVRAFAPEFILISAGFDAHRDDPLAMMELTETGYRAMTEIVNGWAAASANGRIVSCLEGGYNLTALADSATTHVRALAGLST
ncbi:MAG TPA: histone deacetylase [Nitrospiria bacterium]|nr:histone deacetylase [Nitrospiria bacterium]